jgi:hypothetical protein
VGTESLTDYCRHVETYLCQKNDGHLIRVVGPSFDLVSGWAERGIPLKVVFSGIDRCFDRYYRTRPRRRPLKIDFCEADVLEAFDRWCRAVGLPREGGTETSGAIETRVERGARRESLPAHLERAVTRLTAARASGRIGAAFDGVIDAAARELDLARASAHGLRGEARASLIRRLDELESELLKTARAALDEPTRTALTGEAAAELEAFRDRMHRVGFARACEAAFDRLLCERFGLPSLKFD